MKKFLKGLGLLVLWFYYIGLADNVFIGTLVTIGTYFAIVFVSNFYLGAINEAKKGKNNEINIAN